MNQPYASVSTHNSDLLCTTSAYRTSQAVSFNSIVHEGTVYLSIAHSPWRALTKASYPTPDTDLDTLSTSNGDQVQESEEPLRSALLSLAAKRGEYWMKFDQRMDILATDALKRVQEFIDEQHLPRCPVRVHYVNPEELELIRNGSRGYNIGAGGNGGGGSGRTIVGGGGGGSYAGPYDVNESRRRDLVFSSVSAPGISGQEQSRIHRFSAR